MSKAMNWRSLSILGLVVIGTAACGTEQREAVSRESSAVISVQNCLTDCNVCCGQTYKLAILDEKEQACKSFCPATCAIDLYAFEGSCDAASSEGPIASPVNPTGSTGSTSTSGGSSSPGSGTDPTAPTVEEEEPEVCSLFNADGLTTFDQYPFTLSSCVLIALAESSARDGINANDGCTAEEKEAALESLDNYLVRCACGAENNYSLRSCSNVRWTKRIQGDFDNALSSTQAALPSSKRYDIAKVLYKQRNSPSQSQS